MKMKYGLLLSVALFSLVGCSKKEPAASSAVGDAKAHPGAKGTELTIPDKENVVKPQLPDLAHSAPRGYEAKPEPKKEATALPKKPPLDPALAKLGVPIYPGVKVAPGVESILVKGNAKDETTQVDLTTTDQPGAVIDFYAKHLTVELKTMMSQSGYIAGKTTSGIKVTVGAVPDKDNKSLTQVHLTVIKKKK